MKEYCFGVDVGGTTVKIGMFKTSGELVESYEIPTRREDNGKNILPDIAQFLCLKLKEAGIDKSEVEGVGIGVPGPVLENGVVNKCANLGWGRFNVSEKLEELTGFTVRVDNDANVAALGECWKGSASGYESMVMITLGTGIGGGIIYKGKPINGFNGASGEIGHMPVLYGEEETCGCGKRGCLEQVASAPGIVRTAKKLLKEQNTPSELRSLETITAKDVFDYAKTGDAVAEMAVEHFTFYFAAAMAHVAAVIDPEIFVLGGGVSNAGSFLVDAVAKSYREKAFHASADTKIVLASLGNDAGMYGAAKLVIG